MASNRSSVIQFTDGQDAQAELQFQDFTLGESSPGIATLSPSGSYSNFAESPESATAETDDLLGAEKKEGSPSFWTLSYYQSFFDVDTSQVVERILWSAIPTTGRATFLDRQIRPKPDLYGPFWISTTLIYCIAIFSNFGNYMNGAIYGTHVWSYNLPRVSVAATSIYSYAFLLPVILWGLLWYSQSSTRYTLLEILCIYGYSLAVYVPLSLFWVINVSWLWWILVIIAAALSGAVLLQTFWPICREDNRKIATVALVLILFFHVLLAVGYGAYFFQPRLEKSAPIATVSSPTSHVSYPSDPVSAHSGNKVSRSTVETEAKLNHLDISLPDQNTVKPNVKADFIPSSDSPSQEMQNKVVNNSSNVVNAILAPNHKPNNVVA